MGDCRPAALLTNQGKGLQVQGLDRFHVAACQVVRRSPLYCDLCSDADYEAD